MLKTILFLFFGWMALVVNAQSVSLDQDFRNDQARRLQLLGQTDTALSFMIRPIQYNATIKPIPYSKKLGSNWVTLAALPLQLQQQYATSIPFKELDGPMLASSGYQLLATAGAYLQLGPLSVQLQPQYVSAENKDFLQTKGTPVFKKYYWGNSSVRLNIGAISAGISTENISWGPSVFNPLLMSSHAPGFAHATLNSRRPLKTPIGHFEWQMIAAYLDPLDPQYQNLAEVGAATQAGRRYFNGALLVYQPKWIKGFFAGVSRVVQENEAELNYHKQWLLLFNNVDRASDADFNTEQSRDQYASFFMRYVMTPANAEIYLEWGRNDAFFNLRDAIQRLDHSRAYTFGLRKLFNISANKNKYWQFLAENTRMQQPPSWPLLSAGGWYVHSRAVQGYTQEGQILGAPIGVGSNAQTIRIAKFDGYKSYGLQLGRTTQDAVYFESALAFTNPSVSKWVDYECRIMLDLPFKNTLIAASIAYKRAFNYQYFQPATATGLGLKNPNDQDSFLFKTSISF